RCRDKTPGKLDGQDNLRAHSRLGDWRGDRVRTPLAPLVYNREHKWIGMGAGLRRATRVRRQRTSEDLLAVESIPDPERNRIRLTRSHPALPRRVRYKRRVRPKSAHALRGAIAVEGSAANHALPRWR